MWSSNNNNKKEQKRKKKEERESMLTVKEKRGRQGQEVGLKEKERLSLSGGNYMKERVNVSVLSSQTWLSLVW